MIVIAAVAGLLAVVVLGVGIASMRARRAKDIEERLGRYTSEYGSLLAEFEEAEEVDYEQQQSLITRQLDRALEGRGFAQKWRTELARADLKLTVAEYVALHAISMAGAFLVGAALFDPITGGVVGIAGFFFPRFYVSMEKGKRLKLFEGQLPDTLSLWVNALRSGYSVMQSMEAIAKEAPEPTSTEFRRVVMESQLGIPMEDGLEHLLDRMPSEDLDLVNTAVNIQREVGGNLAEILESIGHTIRDRIKLKGEIQVLTSQGRITGWVISMLPIILTMFLYVVSPSYMGLMIKNRMCGWPMIGCGLGLIAAGAAAIQKIVNIDY